MISLYLLIAHPILLALFRALSISPYNCKCACVFNYKFTDLFCRVGSFVLAYPYTVAVMSGNQIFNISRCSVVYTSPLQEMKQISLLLQTKLLLLVRIS